ncbi:MAG TPA: uroporphyrinogen-III synthase [Rhizomicrobium sp.]|nr:uroporphyrinogen-III synthase [Rhizomicrobium sp.]
MRILITRPKEDAERFAEAARARGHEAVCAAVLSVHFYEGPELTLDGVSAVLATSANGVRAFARRTDNRELPVFTVGPQTADAAKRAGFERVECADGDAETLAAAVTGWVKPEDGVLLHAASADNDGKVKALLVEEGYTVDITALYDIIPAYKLPEAAREPLARGTLDAVVVFSQRSAQTLRDCIVRARLAHACKRVGAACMSRQTAEGLAPLEFRAVAVAAHPNQDGLLDCLDELSPPG